MTRQEYLAKRNTLMAEAKACINETRVEDFQAKKAEIETLDAQFEAEATAAANYAALEKSGAVIPDVQNSAPVNGVLERTGNVTDEAETVYKNAFLKNLMGMRLTAEEQSAFDLRNAVTTDNHSVVIPETMVRAIWTEMEELHPILADAAGGRTYVKGRVSIPIGEDDNDAEWYDEATETADSEVTTREVVLDGCELSKAVPVSWKMKEMSIEEFQTFIQHKIAERMSAAWANSYVNGKGPTGGGSEKPQPRGVVTALEAEGSAPQIVELAEDHLTYEELTEAFAKIKSGYLNGSAVYAQNATIWTELANLCDTNGRPIFIPDVTAGSVGRVFGCPVREEASIKAGCILIGNYARGYTSNVNREISLVTEDHAKKRLTDYVGYMIADGDVLSTKAFAYIRPGA